MTFLWISGGLGHRLEVEAAFLAGHLGVEHDLEQEIAQFGLQGRKIAALDGVDIRTDEFHVVLLEDTVLVQCHRRIECGLSTERRQQCIRTLFRDDLLDDVRRDRFDVGRIREFRISHDGGRIGVHEDDAQALGT